MTKRLINMAIALLLPVAIVVILSLMSANSPQQNKTANANANVAGVVSDPGFVPQGVWSDLPNFGTTTMTFGSPGNGSPVPLQLKRASAAAYPPNGKIYIFGGRHRNDGNDISSRSILEYDPSAPATPVAKTALLDSTLYGSRWVNNMAVATLTDANGVRIYAIGGANVNSEITTTVRIYNPTADTITTLSAADVWPASPPRVPGGYAVYNNKLYIFGGYAPKPASAVYADTWVFDPMGAVGSKWTQLASANLGTARGYIAGATLDGYIYAVGGDVISGGAVPTVSPVDNVERLDPTAATPVWQSVAALPSVRGDMGAWAYDSNSGYEIAGKIVVAGGPYVTPNSSAYIYNPGTNTWSLFAPMLRARRNIATAQYNGILYAWGGYNLTANGYEGSNDSMSYDASVGATPTSTAVPPTNTAVPPSATRTNTPVPPTGTSVPSTSTAIPPTSTPVPPTGTSVPPTNTSVPPTSTEVPPTPCAITFSDVPVGSTFYVYVRCMACLGIVTGYPDGTFKPNNEVTRGQLAKIVSNAAGFNDIPVGQAFEDVHPGSTFYTFTQRLASRSIMGGYPCGSIPSEPCGIGNLPFFRPFSTATRGQLSKIVSNAAGFIESSGPQIFEDVPPGYVFYDFVYRLASRNIISGYTCGTPGEPCGPGQLNYFRPGKNASRGQTSKIVSIAILPDCNPPNK